MYIYIVIIVIIICLIYLFWYRNSVEAYKSNIDNNTYKIVDGYSEIEKQQAADMIAKINIFIISTMKYLRNKYIYNDGGYSDNNLSKEQKKNIVVKLLTRYDPNRLRENNPISTKNTSYVLNKGVEVAFCIREKISGNNNFHDFNVLQFVTLHEMSHIGMNGYGHNKHFWKVFKFLTEEAKEAGLYEPMDYSKKSVNYCGLTVTLNPYFYDIDSIMV